MKVFLEGTRTGVFAMSPAVFECASNIAARFSHPQRFSNLEADLLHQLVSCRLEAKQLPLAASREVTVESQE